MTMTLSDCDNQLAKFGLELDLDDCCFLFGAEPGTYTFVSVTRMMPSPAGMIPYLGLLPVDNRTGRVVEDWETRPVDPDRWTALLSRVRSQTTTHTTR